MLLVRQPCLSSLTSVTAGSSVDEPPVEVQISFSESSSCLMYPIASSALWAGERSSWMEKALALVSSPSRMLSATSILLLLNVVPPCAKGAILSYYDTGSIISQISQLPITLSVVFRGAASRAVSPHGAIYPLFLQFSLQQR
jgi:hypothetical protein